MVRKTHRSIDSFLKRKQVQLYLVMGGLSTKESARRAKVTYNYAYRLVSLWVQDGFLEKKENSSLSYTAHGLRVKEILTELEACK